MIILKTSDGKDFAFNEKEGTPNVEVIYEGQSFTLNAWEVLRAITALGFEEGE